jgi:cytochrome c oxidase cbb3-type subunit IV
MELDINTIREAVLLVSFALYIGIVGWAWSANKADDFRQAAELPFETD